MSNNHSQISKTAIPISKIRAEYTNIPFSKDIWKSLKQTTNKKYILLHVLMKTACKIPNLKTRFSGQEIRYLSTNYAIKKEKPSYIIELAAGFSSRGLAFSEEYENYLETDLKDIIKTKEKILKKINPNHKLKTFTLNPLNYDELESAYKKYFKKLPDKKIIILQEGLLTYFSREEQEILRDNIKKFLKEYSPKGAWITPDFSFREKEKGVFRHILRYVERKTKRNYNFFANDSQVKKFLKKAGLKAEVLDNSKILKELSSINKLNLKLKNISIIAKDYRPWIITLK